MSNILKHDDFYSEIRRLISNSRQKVASTVNFVMVETYWHIGKRIVEEEQNGKERADYGTSLISELSKRLTAEFGNGFTARNLRNMRQFYMQFPIWHAVRAELSWSHYRLLISVENETARNYYINETITNNWSTRALERQINSLYYERILSSKDKNPVKEEMLEKTKNLQAEDVLKDPMVLEFLLLKENAHYLESELEQAIIDKLNEFLLELGKGFAFVSRQKRISTESKHFYIDLVFYNYLLKCFVLIDLKTGELTHQDIGQMDMYVRLYEDKYKSADDNPTIGIILCSKKDQTVVKYSVLNDNKHLFATKYQLYLPTEKELAAEIEREIVFFEQNHP